MQLFSGMRHKEPHEGALSPVFTAGPPSPLRWGNFQYCPQSDYITGQVLAVDGGFAIAGIQWK